MPASDTKFVEAHLDNGLHIVMEIMPSVRSAAAGFLARTGSRDEDPQMAGVAHFLEHMCFKGTHQRSWQDITVEFDEMGSYYNAFTSKEKTFYFGWVPAKTVTRQIKLLADMMRSSLPPDEFETEKGVILEEIAMSKDSIESLAWDLIHEHMFPGHSLSWPILGTEETIKALTRDQMAAYFERAYSPRNLLLVVAGRIDPEEVVRCAEEVCGSWPDVPPENHRTPPKTATSRIVRQAERFAQQAVGYVYPAPPSGHADVEVARAVASILGGQNSRFFWNIVQAGLSPTAGVYWMGYDDCGMMMLDGLCQPDKAEAFADAIRREANRIVDQGVTDDELQRVKNKRRTSLAVEAEAAYHRMLQIAGDICDFGRPRTVEERLAEVEAVTGDRVQQLLVDWPITGEGLFLSVGPRLWPED